MASRTATLGSPIELFFQGLNRKLEPPMKEHLRSVYSCVAMALASAAAGAYTHIFTDLFSGGILAALAGIGFALAVTFTPDNGKNRDLRVGYLCGFGFCTGLGLGPLLEMVILINPSIITTAMLATSLIFACFSLCTIFSDQRQMLYLGGTLFSLLSTLLMLSLVNLFVGSALLYQVHLYLGFLIICGFIMYDTAVILEKRRMGDEDYVWHAILLFIDFVDVFRHLVIILTQKEENKRRRSSK